MLKIVAGCCRLFPFCFRSIPHCCRSNPVCCRPILVCFRSAFVAGLSAGIARRMADLLVCPGIDDLPVLCTSPIRLDPQHLVGADHHRNVSIPFRQRHHARMARAQARWRAVKVAPDWIQLLRSSTECRNMQRPRSKQTGQRLAPTNHG
jgi:hypothetical protein